MDATELARRIRDAPDGAEIVLPAGRIEGTFVLGRAVRLVGAGPGETVIDGAHGGAVFAVDAKEAQVHLRGMTITGGRSRVGGGVSVDNGARVRLERCRLEDNRASAGRGGAVNIDRGRLELVDCELAHNRAQEGGAVFVGGDVQALLQRCWFAQNAAERGGGLCVGGGARVRVEDTRFEENQAVRKAHHLFTWGSASNQPHITLVRVVFGDVSAEGPRIVNDSDFKADIVLEHTTWPDDSARVATKRARRKFTLH